MIEKLFDTMVKWKSFPNYKMETKVDIILALYLKDILEHKFKKSIQFILPEFPVHLDIIYPGSSNKSVKIDFVAFTEDNHVYLIEFKTDGKSIRDEQIKYLKVSKKVSDDKGFTKLLHGLCKIYRASYYKDKYEIYFDDLVKNDVLAHESKTYKPVNKSYTTEIVFIVPNIDDPMITQFSRIPLKKCADIIKEKYSDEFSVGFANVIEGF